MAEEKTLEELKTELNKATEERDKAIQARDKISEDYRFQRSEADKLKDFAVKTKKVFEDKGLAKFDDNYNITIIEKKQDESNSTLAEYDKALETIELKMQTLEDAYSKGDVDPDKYTKEHAKLLREETKITNKKNKEEVKYDILNQQKQVQEEATKRAQQEEYQRKSQTDTDFFTNKLAKEFPDHNDLNSDIVKEVNVIIAEKPWLYPDVKVLNTNMKERYAIFDKAMDRMIAKGKLSQEQVIARQRRINAGLSSLDPTPYEEPEKKKKGNDFVKNSMMGNYVTNKFGKDTLKDLDSRFSEFEDSGTLTIES